MADKQTTAIPSAIDMLRAMDSNERIVLRLSNSVDGVTFSREVWLAPDEILHVLERRSA